MKKILFLPAFMILVFMIPTASSTQAQSFFGYQTIGVHTWYFSITWDGKPNLGMGYNFRNFRGNAFTDISAEWQFPLDDMWSADDQLVRVGFYRPIRLQRWFTAAGLHATYERDSDQSVKTERIGASATLLPSYVYLNSTSEAPYGTAGLLVGYDAVLAERKRGADADWEGLTRHGVRVGGHLDLHLERTLGISSNGFLRKDWALKDLEYAQESTEVRGEGELYIGATYHLRRW